MSQRQLTFLFLTVRGVMSIDIAYTANQLGSSTLHARSTHVVTRKSPHYIAQTRENRTSTSAHCALTAKRED